MNGCLISNSHILMKGTPIMKSSTKSSNLTPRIAVFVLAVIASFPFCSTCFAIPLPQDSPKTEITDTSKAANIPIHLHSTHIFLEVMVNGKGPYAFVLDTGAPRSVVDSRIAEETKLKLAGEIAAGGTGANVRTAHFANNVNLGLPGVNLAKQTIVALSMEDFESILGHKIDGILGIDLFQNFVVEIDYAASRLRVYSNESFQYNGDGKVVPITVESLICSANATVKLPGREPVEGNFKIDTGSNADARLNSPFVDQHKLTENLTESFETGGYGIGGESSNKVTRIESFEIGGLKFEGPIVLMSQAKQGAGANANFAGVVGGGLLERCNVIFDFKQKRMILRPNSEFDSPFESDMLGIRWKTGGRGDLKSFVVSSVREDSAAFKAGIEEGDKLVEFNGIKPDQISIPLLQQHARIHNSVVHIAIERGEEIIKLEIKLDRVL